MPSTMTLGMLDAVVAGKTSQEKEEAASALAAHVKAVEMKGLQANVIGRLIELTKASGKPGAADRESAAVAFLALATTDSLAVDAILMTKVVPTMMKTLVTDKVGKVQAISAKAVRALFEKLPACGLANVIDILLDTTNEWPALALQMEVLGEMAQGKMNEQIGRCLPVVIPAVSQLMWHAKAQVKTAAIATMGFVSQTMKNKDLEPFLPSLAECVLNPDAVEKCLERLSSTTFVAEVKSDALAVIAPLLLRGLQPQNTTATKRQCARIIENMSKLVDDPREVAPFVPKLLPTLEKTKESVPDPECREVCTKAFEQLTKCSDMTRACKIVDLAFLKDAFQQNEETDSDLVTYVANMALSLSNASCYDVNVWQQTLAAHMEVLGWGEEANTVCAEVVEKVRGETAPAVAAEEADDAAELLCDCEFSLAYGSKILINNARMKLKRGARYGLCGQNDCGKTSLMRAISKNQLEGFPDPTQVRTVFVETDIQGELSNLSVLDYIFADPLLRNCGITREEMAQTLMSVGFEQEGPASIEKEVGRLSGGWKMKLALARAMLLKADILLLDEPTNHLDTKNRAWVEGYLQSLTNVTSIMVSHDTGFLDRVCTHILHIDNLKINQYRGNLSAFVAQVPEAKHYFELQASKFKFKFPMPGPLEGITSKGRHILKMSNITFTYPTATKPQLNNVSVRVSLSSRVACVGPNGAGKSTMIKLLTGELIPDEVSGQASEVWKHPNCRVAYVAQHAFHHIESHLDKTPNEYIRWRYQYGVDREALKKSTMVETEQELELQKQPIMAEITDSEGNSKKEKRVIKDLTNGRRQEHKGRRNEYEVLLQGAGEHKIWLVETQLAAMGFTKAMKEVDERIASMAAGFNRPLSAAFVEQHIMDIGLEREFATHTKIRALSGGQKVKVVLAAALWKCPHIIIIDEPTNYLDRESLGALAEAIKEFEGGVVIVSHNNEFCKACCPETWVLENHTLNVEGDPEWLAMSEKEKVKVVAEEDDLRDAFGNTVVRKKKATRQDMKKLQKKIAQMRKDGEEVWTDEELEKLGLEAPAAQMN